MRQLAAMFLAVASLLALVGGAAAREPAVRLTYTPAARGMSLAIVAGSKRAGAWQVEIRGVAANAHHRLVIEVAPTDTGWSGTARIQDLARRGGWMSSATMDLSTEGGTPICAQAIHDSRLGITVSTLSISPPTNGNLALIVRVTRTKPGTRLQLTAAIRMATDAFSLGPWIRTGTLIR